MKNVVCSYTCGRARAKHPLAGGVKVELSSSPPARLKEPGSETRLFQFKFSFYLSSSCKPTMPPLQSIPAWIMTFQTRQNQHGLIQLLQPKNLSTNSRGFKTSIPS